jgi:lactate dehydrogenase-like 2-hydroxyacid dehydrogenase
MVADKPVVLVTRKLPEAVEERLAREFRPLLNPDDRRYGAEELIEHSAAAQAVLTCATEAWPAALIDRLPAALRVIATFSAGAEHIDLAAARARGITVTNTPDVLTEATADIAMLCLLGAARRASEGEALVRRAAWRGWSPTELLGLDLAGAVLGIVGMGRIGQAVARRARLGALLPHCRFLSLHCPGSAATGHLIDAPALALLQHGAVLVNTARGTLLDDEAVLAALRDGRLFAAGLDVYEGEPDLHPGYRHQRNCFLLPHLGSATIAARNAMGFRCLDNLAAVFAGRPAPDALN